MKREGKSERDLWVWFFYYNRYKVTSFSFLVVA